jgi:hypothetical protein
MAEEVEERVSRGDSMLDSEGTAGASEAKTRQATDDDDSDET